MSTGEAPDTRSTPEGHEMPKASETLEVPPAQPSAESEPDAMRDQDLLVEWLSSRNELCPVCKYNLRSLASARCPECGWELQLRVGTKESFLAPWIASLVSLCIGAGLGIPSIIMIVMSEGDIFRERFLCAGICMVWFSLCMPLAVILLLAKRKFISMAGDAQRGFAVFTGMFTTLAVIALLANIFGR